MLYISITGLLGAITKPYICSSLVIPNAKKTFGLHGLDESIQRINRQIIQSEFLPT